MCGGSCIIFDKFGIMRCKLSNRKTAEGAPNLTTPIKRYRYDIKGES